MSARNSARLAVVLLVFVPPAPWSWAPILERERKGNGGFCFGIGLLGRSASSCRSTAA